MTKIAAGWDEYAFYSEEAWRAERAGRHSDAAHYRYVANNIADELRREQEEAR